MAVAAAVSSTQTQTQTEKPRTLSDNATIGVVALGLLLFWIGTAAAWVCGADACTRAYPRILTASFCMHPSALHVSRAPASSLQPPASGRVPAWQRNPLARSRQQGSPQRQQAATAFRFNGAVGAVLHACLLPYTAHVTGTAEHAAPPERVHEARPRCRPVPAKRSASQLQHNTQRHTRHVRLRSHGAGPSAHPPPPPPPPPRTPHTPRSPVHDS